MKCSKCGKRIKKVYSWDGKVYGIECWKQIALPELEKQRELKNAEWNEKKAIAVEVARVKDVTKIKSEFKVKVIKDIVSFFDQNGFITNKQYNLLTDQFNNKDRIIKYDMLNEAGLIGYGTYLEAICRNSTGKAYQEAVKKMDEYFEQQQMTV